MPKFAGIDISGYSPGQIISLGHGSTPPFGTLLCDGSAISRSVYAKLFTKIGTAHGAGDGSSTFNLPDYRGRFLRGTDLGAGRDPDRGSRGASSSGGAAGDTVGSVQSDQLGNHSHGVSDPGHAHSVYDPGHLHYAATWNGGGGPYEVGTGGYGIDYGAQAPPTTVSGTGIGIYSSGSGISIAANGGNESRPENANVNFVIAYI